MLSVFLYSLLFKLQSPELELMEKPPEVGSCKLSMEKHEDLESCELSLENPEELESCQLSLEKPEEESHASFFSRNLQISNPVSSP